MRLYGVWVLLLTAFATPVWAQSAQVTPAPIPYPYFEAGRRDYKIAANYVSVDFKNLDFALEGQGVGFSFRQAFSERLALDANLTANTAYGAPGDPGATDNLEVFADGLRATMNVELQAIHSARGSLILFLGGGWSKSSSSIVITGDLYSDFSNYLNAYEAQGGAQAGVPMGGFQFVPYAVISTTLGGSMKVSSEQRGIGHSEQVESLPSSVSSSVGFDIIFVPWNLSVGTALQQAGGNQSNGDAKIKTFQFS